MCTGDLPHRFAHSLLTLRLRPGGMLRALNSYVACQQRRIVLDRQQPMPLLEKNWSLCAGTAPVLVCRVIWLARRQLQLPLPVGCSRRAAARPLVRNPPTELVVQASYRARCDDVFVSRARRRPRAVAFYPRHRERRSARVPALVP